MSRHDISDSETRRRTEERRGRGGVGLRMGIELMFGKEAEEKYNSRRGYIEQQTEEKRSKLKEIKSEVSRLNKEINFGR